MMGFDRFGGKGYITQTKVEPFMEYLERGELRGTKCKTCGRQYFPPRADCCKCLGSKMEWVKVAGSGRLISFTQADYAPAGFEQDVPYTLAVVDFDGSWVFGRIGKNVPEERIKVGSIFKIKIFSLDGGRVTYEFIQE